MMLVISLLLALVPLFGVLWIIVHGSILSVDGLFMSLILLTMSGILGISVLLELRKGAFGGARKQALSAPAMTSSGALLQRGRVESVQFFESNVGQRNRSIVILSNGASSSRMLVFEGDMRNALPVGQKVEITFRKDGGLNVLVNVSYS